MRIQMMERRGVGRVGAALAALLAISTASGCDLEMDEEEPPELIEEPLISMNSLKWENMADNIFWVRLLMTAPFQQSRAIATLADTPEGRQVLTYAVTCALPAGDRIKVENSTGDVFEFHGRLGVDRDWPSATPTQHDAECTGGCMTAHLNGLGRHISISARGQGCGYTLEPAEAIYNFEEGAFAMDVENQMYACTGDDTEQQCGRTASASLGSRICARDPKGRCGQIILCGPCRNICKSRSLQGGYTDCEYNGVRLEMTTTFLEDGTRYNCVR